MKNVYLFLIIVLISFIGTAQNAPFITTWEVGINTPGLDITIPTTGTGYNYTVDFGDSTVLTNQTGDVSHTYASSGVYTVTISGDFPRIYFLSSSMGMEEKIKSVEQWGDIQWQSMNYAFLNCTNLIVNATDAPDLSLVTDISFIFSGCDNFNQSINHWDVSNVSNMEGMFSRATSFNQALNTWDVSGVTNMHNMFSNAYSFNQPLNNWNVSTVINMSGMLEEANSFNQPLEDWDVSNVMDFSTMFFSASSFNQDLSSWQFNSNVDHFYETFGESGLDVDNYDALLQRFVQLGITNKTLGANGLFYCDEIAHNELSNILGWTIMGDNLDNNCNMTIDNNTLASNIVIYPNPTDSELNIISSFPLEKINVYNLKGQVIISSNNNKETSIDLSSLPSGIYFVKTTGNNTVETHKIIKK